MPTEPTEFTRFKYQHDDGATRSTARRWFTGVTLALALALIFGSDLPLPLSLFTLIMPLWGWWVGIKTELLLGPRYLLCGNTLVYYANVKRLNLSRNAGTLQMQSQNGKTFTLVRDKFPTNARKPEKIKINKSAKFDKAVDKIIDKVSRAAPDAHIINKP